MELLLQEHGIPNSKNPTFLVLKVDHLEKDDEKVDPSFAYLECNSVVIIQYQLRCTNDQDEYQQPHQYVVSLHLWCRLQKTGPVCPYSRSGS